MQQAIAGVDDKRNCSKLAFLAESIHDGRGGGAVAVIRDQQGIRGMDILARGQIEFARQMLVRGNLWFAVHANDLLAGGVGHAG